MVIKLLFIFCFLDNSEPDSTRPAGLYTGDLFPVSLPSRKSNELKNFPNAGKSAKDPVWDPVRDPDHPVWDPVGVWEPEQNQVRGQVPSLMR